MTVIPHAAANPTTVIPAQAGIYPITVIPA